MDFHEYANLFPMMADAVLRELGADIKKQGLRDAIVTLDGKILDGRNRYRACELAGVKPRYEAFTGEDALGFVISHNLHRRHLSESQRAMVASKVATMRAGAPEGNRNAAKTTSPIGGVVSTLPHKDRAQAAAELNVGPSSLDRARRVQRDGIPALCKMVEKGEVSVCAALNVSKLSEEEQEAAVSGGAAGVKAAAKAAGVPREDAAPVEDEMQEPAIPGKLSPFRPDQGEDWFFHAKLQMDKIHAKDISREKVLRKMIAYCEERLKTKK